MADSIETADTDTARAFEKINTNFETNSWVHDTLIEVLVEAVELRNSLDAKEQELRHMLDLTRDARKAINALRAIEPHLDHVYVDLEENIDELEYAIAEKELMTQNALEELMLNRQQDRDYQLRAALRFLVERIVLYTTKEIRPKVCKSQATSPDIATLATVIFCDPNDPDMTIHDERVHKVRRELGKRKGRATPYWPY
jgi:hypothetical protein